ncbi:PucR family transcriptional regulator [[Clostridium] scindens]|uniref:PucR family transcriptional regulator n=1 Tax=Clostridium scindens (strain JCM 10418 / VPI 12708) TaxID=29347 RepID=UPI0004706111|nr:PucR family transcriptional regulator [[Clostridium] scindens]MCB6284885.1 PucR family transcriptional regulator ligand-binding domain-containing protein [[Clostridium] scindens]MCB6419477.1 PucR family transcriptional regulator ligand-binding domain-containing protein [[Clostridium] scindens]MCB7191106.1 PucR family transcriptional regulator ligand-binding domain-containing protein [[Clostridium] scindens]MCB7284066.1 PucR family transcriptional regulator ligand-binding domain-containing pr
MAVRRKMGFSVNDLLLAEELKDAKILGGKEGLDRQIKGVTIIEAPDIVKFINGGEVLLTGLYAFRSCSVEEFQKYINELTKKSVSALIMKRGRKVENADIKIELLLEFANTHGIPVLEVPFEISFRDIMSRIMERLFNEEVTRLKYFKTTHDNFAALALSPDSGNRGADNILDVLAKLIHNPVAVFNQNLSCLAATEDAARVLTISEDARTFEPGIYSSYTYLRQEGEEPQCLIQVKMSFREKIYLVVTERNQALDVMDCIAAESAITALRFEFSRQYAVTELEKKFQNDIMHNILNGKIHSIGELQKNTTLLGVDINGSYRVIVFGMANESMTKGDFKAKVKDTNVLSQAIVHYIKDAKIQNDLDKIVVIQAVDKEQTQEEYRREIKKIVESVQEDVSMHNKHLKVKAGVGKVVDGIIHLPESFKEANEAFMFVDVAGELSEEGSPQAMLFSDLGIFKLLCQLEDPSMLLEYVPEGLQKLYNYKKPQRDDLIVTLKTYLDRNQNLSKTAQELYVHYKTAAYRIEKITKITGIDFDNANEVLAVRIGLVVYKMIENYNKDFI